MRKQKSNVALIVLSILGAIGALFISIALFIWIIYQHPSVLQSTYTIELGEELDDNPSLYWKSKYLDGARLNTSGVDYSKTGTYSFSGTLRKTSANFTVNIIDTTAPTIKLFSDKRYYKQGEAYALSEFYDSITDLAPFEVVISYNNQELRESLSEGVLGEHEAEIIATDESGNVARQKIVFGIDESPRLIGLVDAVVRRGEKFDALQGIMAVDTVDGNRTHDIIVDAGSLDTSKAGTYTITYRVKDEYGLETFAERNVIVTTKSMKPETPSVSSEDMKLLCTYECFDYEPFSTKKSQKVVETLVEPCLVSIYQETSTTRAYASGFIYDITPEYTYILSVHHVTRALDDCEFKIMWFDKTITKVKPVKYISAKDNELSMFRVPTKDIPVATLLKLKEAYIDERIYDELKPNDNVLSIAKNFRFGGEDKINYTYITNVYECGAYNKKHPNEEVCYGLDYYQYRNTPVQGMSGTATFDMRGRLTGVVSFGLDSENGIYGYDARIDTIPALDKRRSELN